MRESVCWTFFHTMNILVDSLLCKVFSICARALSAQCILIGGRVKMGNPFSSYLFRWLRKVLRCDINTISYGQIREGLNQRVHFKFIISSGNSVWHSPVSIILWPCVHRRERQKNISWYSPACASGWDECWMKRMDGLARDLVTAYRFFLPFAARTN